MSSASLCSKRDMPLIYTTHQGWLLGVLHKRLGSGPDAADLMQDVFVRLLSTPRDFDSLSGAKHYLGSMAKGLCIDFWRRRELEQLWLEAVSGQPERLACSPEHRAIVLETLCQVDHMLRTLPEKARTAFVMSQLQGRTYREIALVLRVSERMVKKYMAQAMLHCMQLELSREQADVAS